MSVREGYPLRAVYEHYERGLERDRLDTPLGSVEFERTKQVLLRRLPAAPATVADVGGGPGRYSMWLAQAGYRVLHRDLVPLHVEQARAGADAASLDIHAAVADARALDLANDSVDALLLLGPLYHLPRRDRARALAEAHRVLRPGGVLFAAAISRWAPRLHAELVQRLYRVEGGLREAVTDLERTGAMPPLYEGSFNGFCHRPAELRSEVSRAGFAVEDLVAVEGLAFALPDLEERLADLLDRAVVLEAAAALERVPELLGLGPHLLVTATKSATGDQPRARAATRAKPA